MSGDDLLAVAREIRPELSLGDLTTDVLARLTAEVGVDRATAVYVDRIRRAPRHRDFLAALAETAIPPRKPLNGKLLVAPAALYQELPAYGGAGQRIRPVAQRLGWTTGVIPSASLGSVRENAAVIAEVLAPEDDRSVVLVSLSKGGADVRRALEEGGDAVARKIRFWIQVGGVLHGTPLADEVLGSWWRRRLIALYLKRWRAGLGCLEDLTHGRGSLLASRFHVPEELPVAHVLACPLRSHLGGGRRRRHRKLAAWGPNDGSTLLADAVADRGWILPVWGADHFFRTPRVEEELAHLLAWVAAR